MVFRDASLISGFEAFKLANQRKNNIVETSNFPAAIFLTKRDYTAEEGLYLYTNYEIVFRYIL
jgi:hypothetical protein